jgi:hypothetical protein
MLAYERLDAGGSTGPRSASRRSASACVRPSERAIGAALTVDRVRARG